MTSRTALVAAAAMGITALGLVAGCAYAPTTSRTGAGHCTKAKKCHLFILGDSISLRLREYHLFHRMGRRWVVRVDACVGRDLAAPGSACRADGLEAASDDAAAIRRATVIVIELGTNPDTSTFPVARLIHLIHRLRGYSLERDRVRIGWVNIGNLDQFQPTINPARNRQISRLAGKLHYTVINWAAVFQPAWIDTDGIHPNITGCRHMARMIRHFARWGQV